ncbi:hypothetical protein OWM07_00355 [Deferribacter thermophilus]|uniref:hypothetical protein n=1 Tax=Deferribacter thermophilus TaxID=53573 RepID=UPI003C14CB47
MLSLIRLLNKLSRYNFITLFIAFLLSVFLVNFSFYFTFNKSFNETTYTISENIKYLFASELNKIKASENKLKSLHNKYSSLIANYPSSDYDKLIFKIKDDLEKQLKTNVSVAIIDKNLKIIHTTLNEEKGLDLSQFDDAKAVTNYLKEKKDNNIVNIEYPVYTPADNNFKIYTLSFLKEKNIFFQLGISTSILNHFVALTKSLKSNYQFSLVYFADKTPLYSILGSMIEFNNEETNSLFKNNFVKINLFSNIIYASKILNFKYLKDMPKPIDTTVVLVIKLSKRILFNFIMLSTVILFITYFLIYYIIQKNMYIYKVNFLLPFIKILKRMKSHKFVEKSLMSDVQIKELNLLSKYYNTHLNELLNQKKSLENALNEIKTLKKLVPICSSCKKIRGKDDNWYTIEEYMSSKFEFDFSHGICPDCIRKLYPEYADKILKELNKK